MKNYSLSALLAAGLLAGAATSASAADLGGNCCADLEERIAELEATTVRKGNRKVSLTISGWVAEQVTWWDDGTESNTYVSGIGTTLSSHFKMTGEAKITAGWSAGYVLHVEVNSNDPFFINQANDDSGIVNLADVGTGVRALQSYWYLKSEQLGKVSVGRVSQASDNTAILVDGSGSLVPANWVMFDGSSFVARSNGALTGVTWGSLGFCQSTGLGIGADCNGVPLNAVRYDSPTFAGFSVSASWGEDDFWDVAARYAGEFGGFKLAVAAAYSHTTDENVSGTVAHVALPVSVRGQDVDYFQVGAYLQHVPTGLFVYGAYGREDVNTANRLDPLNDGLGGEQYDSSPDHWYVKAGIRQKWTPLGHTVLYGEYGRHNNMAAPRFIDTNNATTFDSEVQRWGVGLVQEIDAAAMSLWLSYRNMDGDFTINGVKTELDELHMVKFGALIAF